MHLYLPVAHITVNIFYIVLLGGISGFLSGLYGIGGGIISTPAMILLGVPSNVAVGTASFQLFGSAIGGSIRNITKNLTDVKAAIIMFIGSFIGSNIGIRILWYFTRKGLSDIIVPLVFILIILTILSLMIVDLIKFMNNSKLGKGNIRNKIAALEIVAKRTLNYNTEGYFRVYSRVSQMNYNLISIIAIGLVVGFLSGLIGIGGGVISIPMMNYFLGIPFKIASATALLQVVFISLNNLVLQSTKENVDLILGFFLLISSSITTQIGIFVQSKTKSIILKSTFVLLLLLVVALFAIRLFGQYKV